MTGVPSWLRESDHRGMLGSLGKDPECHAALSEGPGRLTHVVPSIPQERQRDPVRAWGVRSGTQERILEFVTREYSMRGCPPRGGGGAQTKWGAGPLARQSGGRPEWQGRPPLVPGLRSHSHRRPSPSPGRPWSLSAILVSYPAPLGMRPRRLFLCRSLPWPPYKACGRRWVHLSGRNQYS